MEDLKEVWKFSGGGDLPVRSEGSRWVNHKRKALQCLVDRYGAYLNHLAAMTEDRTIKSTDQVCLKGYLQKWKQAKVLIGAAMYSSGQKKVNIPFPLHEDDTGTKRKRNEGKTRKRIHETARKRNGRL